MTRKFTGPELKALRLDEPEDSEFVEDIDTGVGSHGTQKIIVFKFEGVYWRLIVDYHHEDWEGTSDICQCIKYYEKHQSTLEAEQVKPRVIETMIWEKIR